MLTEDITNGGAEAAGGGAGAGLLRVAASGLHREANAAASLLRLLPPDDVEAASLRARALVLAGRPEAALRAYTPLPASARETPTRATALRLLGRWNEAEQCLDHCAPGRPTTADGTPAHSWPVGPSAHEWTAECAALALDRGEPVLGRPAQHWAQQALRTAQRTDADTAAQPRQAMTPTARTPEQAPRTAHPALDTPPRHHLDPAPLDPAREAVPTADPATGSFPQPHPAPAPPDPGLDTTRHPHPVPAAPDSAQVAPHAPNAAPDTPPQPHPAPGPPGPTREVPRREHPTPTPGTAYACSLLAAACAAAGLFGAALDAADAAVRELEVLGEDGLLRRLDAVCRVADALFHTGRRHAAERWLEAALVPAREAGQELVAGRLELGLARARLAAEDHAAAGRWAERAAESARRTGGVPLAVDADLWLARIRLAAGDSVAALAAARAAARGARPLGGVWRDRAQARLREVRVVLEQEAPGTVPPAAPGDGDAADGAGTAPGSESASLSRREAQVALLVSEGCTNHQIAARLQVSPKTVETHLSRIFKKLGITSRAQVAHWVGVGAGPARDIGG